MRSSFAIIALILILANCTKTTSDEKAKTASALTTSASASGSAMPDQSVTADGLVLSAASANTSTILGSAFKSVCPSSYDINQNNPKCLYYRDRSNIYQLCFPSRKAKLIFSLDKVTVPLEKIKVPFEVASGLLMWKAEEDLYVWDGTKAFFMTESAFVTSFLFSPNGLCLVWNTNWSTDFPDENEVRFSDSENRENIVFISKTGSQDRKEIYKQAYQVIGRQSDNREEKKLIAWSKIMPSTLYMTTRFETQLYGGQTGLYAVDFAAGTETLLGDGIEEYLAMTGNETKIAYTPNDETCCSGSNYTNNSVIIWNVVSKKSVIVYDEWKENGNEGNEDEYVPTSAAFSPDDSLIAISIVGTKHFTTIRKVDGGGNVLTVADRFVIGWIDQDTLIIGKRDKIDFRHKDMVQEVYTYELKTGKEIPLSLNNVTYLAFK